MTNVRFLGAHRSWEDWLGMLLGIVVGLSPWISGEMGSQATMFNAVVVGALVFMLSQIEAADLHRWQEGVEIALGAWLGASPFIFGYAASGVLRLWHFALAAIIVALALLELSQDWTLSDEELAAHGR